MGPPPCCCSRGSRPALARAFSTSGPRPRALPWRGDSDEHDSFRGKAADACNRPSFSRRRALRCRVLGRCDQVHLQQLGGMSHGVPLRHGHRDGRGHVQVRQRRGPAEDPDGERDQVPPREGPERGRHRPDHHLGRRRRGHLDPRLRRGAPGGEAGQQRRRRVAGPRGRVRAAGPGPGGRRPGFTSRPGRQRPFDPPDRLQTADRAELPREGRRRERESDPAVWIPGLTEIPASSPVVNTIASPAAYNGLASIDGVSAATTPPAQPTATGALGWEQISRAATDTNAGFAPSPRTGMAVALTGDGVYVGGNYYPYVAYGGADGAGAPADSTPTVHAFNPDGLGWTSVQTNTQTSSPGPFPSNFASFGLASAAQLATISRGGTALAPGGSYNCMTGSCSSINYNLNL